MASSVSARTTSSGDLSVVDARRRLVGFWGIASAFFMVGAVVALNDIVRPYLQAVFGLSYARSTLVQSIFFIGYFLMSLPSGVMLERFGTKRNLVGSLVVMGGACAAFVPASWLQSFPLFLVALLIMAGASTLLMVTGNTYVTQMGGRMSASSRLTLAHTMYTVGSTVAPFFGAMLILGDVSGPGGALKADALISPYLGLTAVLGLVAAFFFFFRLPSVGGEQSGTTATIADAVHGGLWKCPHLVLGIVSIFMYVGAEVGIGSFLVSYISLPEVTGKSADIAGQYLSWYWGGAVAGRLIGIVALQKIAPSRALVFNGLVAAGLVTVAWFVNGEAAMVALLAVGLCNSIMFPTIMTLALADLGAQTARASGALYIGIVGGAAFPYLIGTLADHFGLHMAMGLPIISYVFVVYYGLRGHKLRSERVLP